MTAKKDLTIYQGSTFRFQFTITEIDEYRNETAMDLTGCEVGMQIRPSHRSNDLILDLGDSDYIKILDAPNGVIEIDVPASVTEDLNFSSGVYDIEIKFPDDFVIRIIEGRVTLSLEVTR